MTTFTELREGTLKTAVFTFGRFNPPTVGHEVLVNKIETVAKRNRADAFVFLSSSQDSKKNPLDYKNKVKWMKKMFKPRQKPVVIEKKKPIRRKCFNCGKMKTNPYIFTVVPSISMYDNKIPLYNKNITHTNRIDLKDKLLGWLS